MIVIVDYDAGNIRSVQRAFHYFGKEVAITRDLRSVKKDDLLVLPGVGSFGHAVESLKKSGCFDQIKTLINDGQPFLGICLGLQLLFEASEENPGVEGLSVFKGRVKKFVSDTLPIPQIGWNTININNNNQKAVSTYKAFDNKYFYFVHSYYIEPVNQDIILYTTDYGGEYASAVYNENVVATQFHPEKSGKDGLAFLKATMEHFKV